MLETHQQVTREQFAKISEVVYRHCGINLHEGKRELVQARIAKRMRIKMMPNIADYLRFAFDDSQEFTHLIDALSTNLTSFFRESAHFDHLTKQFLPALMQRKERTRNLRLRAWSAGCSTGEEPYTIAMSLLDTIPANKSWDVKLLATDLSTDVLAKARRGVFEAPRARQIPPDLRARFIQNIPGSREVAVSDELKDIIRFAHLNLMENWPFNGPFDFIFCRNVMIYFDKLTQEKLVSRFYGLLDKGGLLFTGHSESLTGISHRFGYVLPTIYVKN